MRSQGIGKAVTRVSRPCVCKGPSTLGGYSSERWPLSFQVVRNPLPWRHPQKARGHLLCSPVCVHSKGQPEPCSTPTSPGTTKDPSGFSGAEGPATRAALYA